MSGRKVAAKAAEGAVPPELLVEIQQQRPPQVMAWQSGVEPVVLLGTLGDVTAGRWIVTLMELGQGPWWIVVFRAGGVPTTREHEAADRLHGAARLLGVNLAAVVVATRGRGCFVAGEGQS